MATAGATIASPDTAEDAISAVTVEDGMRVVVAHTGPPVCVLLQSIADVRAAELLPVPVAAAQHAAVVAQHAAVVAQHVAVAAQLVAAEQHVEAAANGTNRLQAA